MALTPVKHDFIASTHVESSVVRITLTPRTAQRSADKFAPMHNAVVRAPCLVHPVRSHAHGE
jgi:hypothetical protein